LLTSAYNIGYTAVFCHLGLPGRRLYGNFIRIFISYNTKANKCSFYRLSIILSLKIQLSRGEVRIPLAGLTPPHFCSCPRPVFPTSYVVVFFMSNFMFV